MLLEKFMLYKCHNVIMYLILSCTSKFSSTTKLGFKNADCTLLVAQEVIVDGTVLVSQAVMSIFH